MAARREAVRRAGSERALPVLVSLLCTAASFACASGAGVHPSEEAERHGPSAPERVLVFDFAASPDDEALSRAIPARVAPRAARDETDPQRVLGRRAARVLANRVVDGLWSFGIPARRADDRTSLGANDLVVTGQFVTFDEGNRVARTAIGFGIDGGEVRAQVQLYRVHSKQAQLLTGFQTIARSSGLPGVATGATGVSRDSVEADARRAADAVVTEILRFFIGQDWLPPDALQ